jgi:hypothetical protein
MFVRPNVYDGETALKDPEPGLEPEPELEPGLELV